MSLTETTFRKYIQEAFQERYALNQEFAPNIWDYYYEGALAARKLLLLLAPEPKCNKVLVSLTTQEFDSYIAACTQDRRQRSMNGSYTEAAEQAFWKELGKRYGFDPETVIWENATYKRISANPVVPITKVQAK